MKIVLLDTAGLGADIDLSPLQDFPDFTSFEQTSPAQMDARIKDAEVLITASMKLSRHNLGAAEKLKLICVAATGYDQIDVAYCREKGIGLCNVAGYSTNSVAQHTLSMVLALSNHLIAYRDLVHSGDYGRSGKPFLLTPVWHELEGKTWGIIGAGNIGRRVAKMAEGFGCKILVFRRSPDPDYEAADLDTVLQRSDIVSVHLPLNEQTRGIISTEKIALMKKGAIFVNVARGAVADEEALTRAIESGHLGALGCDVFSKEPFLDDHPYSRILNRHNVILTPHSAWGAQEARNRCIAEIAENIKVFLNGGRRNRVD